MERKQKIKEFGKEYSKLYGINQKGPLNDAIMQAVIASSLGVTPGDETENEIGKMIQNVFGDDDSRSSDDFPEFCILMETTDSFQELKEVVMDTNTLDAVEMTDADKFIEAFRRNATECNGIPATRLMSIMASIGEEITPEQADEMIKQANANAGDEKEEKETPLSYEGFLAMMQSVA